MISLKHPGKLYLAGEYHVVAGGKAIIGAFDRFLEVQIHSALLTQVITEQADEPLIYINSSDKHPGFTSVDQAIAFGTRYLQELRIPVQSVSITILSRLDEGSMKIGLGSSGVVIVSVLDGLLQYHGIKLSKKDLFKLAYLVNYSIDATASGGDLAASIYSGVICYQRPIRIADADLSLIQQMNGMDVRIAPLDLPDIALAVLWSVSPVQSPAMVRHYLDWRSSFPDSAKLSDNEAQAVMAALLEAVSEKDSICFLEGIRHYHQWMRKLSKQTGLPIETPMLSQAMGLAEQADWICKISGAGGGDCALAFNPVSQASRTALEQVIKETGVQVLDLQIWRDYDTITA